MANLVTLVKPDLLSYTLPMQISVKTPPELTVPILEKCAVLKWPYPSSIAQDCTFQCIQWMDRPHSPFRPLDFVERYFYAMGREEELFPPTPKPSDDLLRPLEKKYQAERAEEAAKRLAEFHEQTKKQPPPKHLQLKISEGMISLPKRIREKAAWLQIKPNALVVACLRDCLAAMDDPKKAWVPPPIVVDFWTVSKAHLRAKPKDALGAMVLKMQEGMFRSRSGPLLDTLIRYALKEEWQTPLEQILRDAGVFPEDEKPES